MNSLTFLRSVMCYFLIAFSLDCFTDFSNDPDCKRCVLSSCCFLSVYAMHCACSSRSRLYPVSIREHGWGSRLSHYFYWLVLSGPLPETIADSMRPYMRLKKRRWLYKLVCGVFDYHVIIILICSEYKKVSPSGICGVWVREVKNCVCKCVVLCFFFTFVCSWERAKRLRELESSDSTQPLPTQTWAWLLLQSNKS